MTVGFSYTGSELDLFSTAFHWKSYIRDQIGPYLGEDVLEVGAGIGGTTRALCRGIEKRWLCLEPDASLAGRLENEIHSGVLPACCEARIGSLERITPSETFDTILYMDVLEHIEDDHAEVALACRLLREKGHLVALSPAHPWLFSPFDRSIGHLRRYTKASFGSLAPEGFASIRLDYLDSIGFFASLANKIILKSAQPSQLQIAFWDRVLVRMSQVVDPILGHSAGKSVLAVWRKTPAGNLARTYL